ncbi:F-box protein At5g49610 isoform X5 [Aegilops tauschii subsp. strangulata]|nr:putative F-box protein At5g62660 isoform X5 [Aegilops tauschii subsp. strangulata]
MPPGGGGGEHGCTEQDHPLATGRRDEGAPSYPMPPPPLIVLVASEKKKKKKKKKHEQEQEHEKHPAGSLPEGPLVEILSRVPYKSLCRFKCVSKPWLALCSDPDIRKRSPKTMQCCGGLVLCKYWESRYVEEFEYNLVVCNPATKKWAELPPNPIQLQDEDEEEVEEYLCFDPAVPSRFVVLTHTWDFTEVAIYSSDTGRWTTVETGWTDEAPVGLPVFLNGTLHLMTTEYSIVTVDTEGKVWGQIDIPGNMRDSSDYPFIGQSQGRLYAWSINDNIDVCQLSVWALEDYGGAKWALKYTVNISELFGRNCCKYVEPLAIHPDCDLIFLADRRGKAISYDMDSKKVHVIGTYQTFNGAVPYVPCFAEWPSDGH